MESYDYTEDSIRCLPTAAEITSLEDGVVDEIKVESKDLALSLFDYGTKDIVEYPIGVVVDFFVASPSARIAYKVTDLYYLDTPQHRKCWRMNVSEIKTSKVKKEVMNKFACAEDLSEVIFNQRIADIISRQED